MKRHYYLLTGLALLALAAIVLYAAGIYVARQAGPLAPGWGRLGTAQPSGPGGMRGLWGMGGMGGGTGARGMGMMGPMRAQRPSSFHSNGERIYFTGIDDRDQRIGFEGGPPWLAAQGGSCVDCHGPHGRGGVPVMMGTAIPADIRYSALTAKEHAEEGGHMEHPPYTDKTIKRAITQGVDPAGNPLDQTMPRFQVSDRDLNDLISFLKELDTK